MVKEEDRTLLMAIVGDRACHEFRSVHRGQCALLHCSLASLLGRALPGRLSLRTMVHAHGDMDIRKGRRFAPAVCYKTGTFCECSTLSAAMDYLTVNPPHSPTSSLRAVYVRSRPTSEMNPDGSATEFQQFAVPMALPNVRIADPPRAHHPKRPRAVTVTNTIRSTSSARTTSSLRVVRRDAEFTAAPDDSVQWIGSVRQGTAKQSLTARLRGRVNVLFHRRGTSPAHPQPADSTAALGPLTPELVEQARLERLADGLAANSHLAIPASFASVNRNKRLPPLPVEHIAVPRPTFATLAPESREARIRRLHRSVSFPNFSMGDITVLEPTELYEVPLEWGVEADLSEEVLEAVHCAKTFRDQYQYVDADPRFARTPEQREGDFKASLELSKSTAKWQYLKV
ncbi:unnamed protein product [Mycena citricolor]|uniref:Uncharacterized protein n=1 Tax=Mycena citricolor TaxID=2018698 RepID=A0AAD2K0L3_9AGAR|nr:unnamed protein product [Mycena citricolor]